MEQQMHLLDLISLSAINLSADRLGDDIRLMHLCSREMALVSTLTDASWNNLMDPPITTFLFNASVYPKIIPDRQAEEKERKTLTACLNFSRTFPNYAVDS